MCINMINELVEAYLYVQRYIGKLTRESYLSTEYLINMIFNIVAMATIVPQTLGTFSRYGENGNTTGTKY